MRKYSIGLFLDIFTDKESEWLDSLEFINSLNGVEHLEILPEYIPSNKEFNFFFNLQEQYRFIIHATSLDLTVLSPHKVINSEFKCTKRLLDLVISDFSNSPIMF